MNFNYTIALTSGSTRISSEMSDEASDAVRDYLDEKDLDTRCIIIADRRRAAGLAHDEDAANAYDAACYAGLNAATAGWEMVPEDLVVTIAPVDAAMIAESLDDEAVEARFSALGEEIAEAWIDQATDPDQVSEEYDLAGDAEHVAALADDLGLMSRGDYRVAAMMSRAKISRQVWRAVVRGYKAAVRAAKEAV